MSREVDARIAREVFGLDVFYRGHGTNPRLTEGWKYGDGTPVPEYTEDDADALAALDALCAKHGDALPEIWMERHIYDSGHNWVVRIRDNSDGWRESFMAPTRPLAICRAIIAFLDWRKEQGNG